MDKLHLIIYLLVSTFFLLSKAYNPSVSYFINSGSTTSLSLNGRYFTGDENSDDLITGKSKVVKTQNPSINSLYSTARLFEKASFYKFKVSKNEVYMVRFHFVSLEKSNSETHFSVLASGNFPLLSNFSLGNSSLVVIKEFLVQVREEKFRIYFEPSDRSSMAFVSAIELFILPSNFIENEATNANIVKGGDLYKDILSHSLYTVFRINVGGDNLTPENDTLWRDWVPDDKYLVNPKFAKKSDIYSDNPNYPAGGSTEEIAPAPVYQTAREMNIDSNGGSNLFNVTWKFPVTSNAMHLVRTHFCDISDSTNFNNFNLYLYSSYGTLIDPYGKFPQLASAFYCDFVVNSDNSGFMDISIGISHDLRNKTAFLNGLEILELITNSGTLPVVKDNEKSNLVLIIGSVAGVMVLLFSSVTIIFAYLRKHNKAKPNEAASEWQAIPLYGFGSTHSKIGESTVSVSPLLNLNLGWKQSLTGIKIATRNFDPMLIIGEGGFGKVYKGTFKDGSEVAIKRSEPGHGQGLLEFQTEIVVLSQIRHRHLVSLIGYCDENSEMILVYEFMEKGTLRDHLYASRGISGNSISQSELSWNKRLEICIGAAKGLHYLHSDRNIIHRDVKSTNILLDEHYVAKVADFGLSRLDSEDQTHVSTDIKGSFGYLDPEYFQCLQITQKSDVYSFGVVLLEVLCARPPIDNSLPREHVNLAEWGLSSLKKGEMAKIVDPLLEEKINPNSLKLFCEIVEKCLKVYGVDRPSMHDVMWDLEYALSLQQSSSEKEVHDESTNEASWGLPSGSVRHMPSYQYDISTADFPEDSTADSRSAFL